MVRGGPVQIVGLRKVVTARAIASLLSVIAIVDGTGATTLTQDDIAQT